MIARSNFPQNRPSVRTVAVSGQRVGSFAMWVVAITLPFNVLMPITQVRLQKAHAAAGIEQIVICAAHAISIMAFKDGTPVDTDPAKAEHIAKASCPLCAAISGYAVLPVGVELVLTGASSTVLYGAASQSTPAYVALRPPKARAPPAIV
jgi:hypothetical protein